jgi:hypothetical protein
MTPRVIARLAVVAAAVLALAGCAPGATPASAPTPPIPITHPHAQGACPDVPTRHFDESPADVVAVFRCTADFHEVQGVLNKVQYVDELRDDPAELLAAYARPDEEPTDGACTADERDPLILWVDLENDETIAIYAPLDGCGKPQAEAADAYAAADFGRVLVAREVAED